MNPAMHFGSRSRRRFFAVLAGLAGAAAADLRGLRALVPAWPLGHPDPRPGIDASKVLDGDRVRPELKDLYDRVRRIPQIVDGIRCQCGCAEVEGFYSLLTCYESSGMALYCDICRDVGDLVTRLHEQGRTLDEIRAEVDRRFG